LCRRKNNIMLCTSKARLTPAHEIPGSALHYSVPASGSTSAHRGVDAILSSALSQSIVLISLFNC
jgi:hypothetical protein